MKISIITATRNSSSSLQSCINSVHSQTYPNKEYIIVDGKSSDNTLHIIRENSDKINTWISEKDNGIYDAINKGIQKASGDVIGLLHSDDTFANENVLAQVAEALEKYNIDSVYGDLVYVTGNGNPFRIWISGPCTEAKILDGWMPPHPTLFVKKEVFNKCGLYRTDMKISADYEMVLRLFYKHKITTHYLPLTTYYMTTGGASNKSLENIITKSKEDYRAIKIHELPSPVRTLLMKNLRKLPQFFRKVKN
jgi:glycosyltransferase